jgi:lipase
VKLNTRQWGQAGEDGIVCIHGVAQHGAVFEELGERLAASAGFVVAVDLRGHGTSGHEPPWNLDTHVQDVEETVRELGIERPTWIGHSFGGLVAAALAVG